MRLNESLLVPPPATIREEADALIWPMALSLVLDGDAAKIFPIARQLADDYRTLRGGRLNIVLATNNVTDSPAIRLRLSDETHQGREAYRLTIRPDGVEALASDPKGLFYAAMTLRQLIRHHGAELPCGIIEDEPAIPVRGIMLDISRMKVPTMSTLFRLVDWFSEMKINHLELYTEHTFAYSNHRDVWAEASPMTGAEILALDAFCRERCIELVPNQNSLGHMEHWLKHPRYAPLAETNEGFTTPWGEYRTEPTTVNPLDPNTLTLFEELYAELLPHFTSRKFNVGCDEPFELGLGKSKAECERVGKGRVYLDYLLKLHKRVDAMGRQMHFWGDIINEHPELIPEIPTDVTVLEWGYESHHPFAERGPRFSESGIPFYVCPGTSSWLCISGRSDNALVNMLSAAESAVACGATGYLNTDWGDRGHWQPLSVSYLPLAAGASYSWNPKHTDREYLMQAVDCHVFKDQSGVMSHLAYRFGENLLDDNEEPIHGSKLFLLLRKQTNKEWLKGLTVSRLEQAAAQLVKLETELASTSMGCADAGLIADEYHQASALLRWACLRGIALLNGKEQDPATRDGLLREWRRICGQQRDIWLARNRIGGLDASIRELGLPDNT